MSFEIKWIHFYNIYIYVYIIINTPYRSTFLDAFKKGVSYAHQGGIYLIKNTVKSVILWNIITIQNNWFQFEYIKKSSVFLWCKAVFSASLRQSSVSYDTSEVILICWFAAQETFIFTIVLKKKCAT